MAAPDIAISVRGLRKNYPGAAPDIGLNGVDLTVAAGTVCGLLGPNGAGKTTMIRILATLLAADEGEATVAGWDVATDGHRVRERIGLVGQHAAVDEVLSGRQNLVMFGRLNHLSTTDARRRADDLLDRFALGDTGRKPVGAYSGGMRRRLDLAAGLIVAPRVLFVDEPTTGLDPAGRREVWTAIRALVDQGTTVLLTTQYLEEADQLADRIVMLGAGTVIAQGTPAELKARVGDDWLEVVVADEADAAAVARLAQPVACADVRTDALTVRVPVADRAAALIELAAAVHRAGIMPRDLTVRRPTLDEVFFHLNGVSA